MNPKIRSPLETLQEQMVSRLNADLAASALAGRIFNEVPQAQPYPFLFLGVFSATSSPTKDQSIFDITGSIDIFSDKFGNEELERLIDLTLQSLTRTPPLPLTGSFTLLNIHSATFSTAQETLVGGGTRWHGTISLLFRIIDEI